MVKIVLKAVAIAFLVFVNSLNDAISFASWPGWGEDFQGRITVNNQPISNALIGAEFGCCTQSDSDGNFIIGLREGTSRIYILPSGSESELSAPSFFNVTISGKSATSVKNENGQEVAIVNGIREFNFEKPNLLGVITSSNAYANLKAYSRIVSGEGQSDLMSNRTQINNQFGYKLKTSGKYIIYLEYRGSQQLFAISKPCEFNGTITKCPEFKVNDPNFIVRLVSSSGKVQEKTSITISPILDNSSLNGLDAWQNEDLTFRYFLSDGLYLMTSYLKSDNNRSKFFEIKVKDGKVFSVLDLFSAQEHLPENGIYNIDYQAPSTIIKYSIKTLYQTPGGAVFQLDPNPKISFRLSILDGTPTSSIDQEKQVNADSNGIVKVTGYKKGSYLRLVMRSAINWSIGEFPSILAYSEPNTLTLLSPEEEAEAKAKAEAEAKAKAEAEAKAKAEAQSKLKSQRTKCIKGKTIRYISGTASKCPVGFSKK